VIFIKASTTTAETIAIVNDDEKEYLVHLISCFNFAKNKKVERNTLIKHQREHI
jgi:hypothetical protein